MKIIKKQSKQTYKNKEGKEKHFYNYFVQFENGKRIQIKCAFPKDYVALDMVVEFEK